MKKRFKSMICMAMANLLLLSAIGCKKEKPAENNPPQQEEELVGDTVYIFKDGATEVSLVYAKGCDFDHSTLADHISQKLTKDYGVANSPETIEYTAMPASGKELLFGAADRPLSQELVKAVNENNGGHWWAYACKDGNVAYYASSQIAMQLSWDDFIAFMCKEQTMEIKEGTMVTDGITDAQYEELKQIEAEYNAAPDTEILKMQDGQKAIVTIIYDDADIDAIRFLNSEFEKHNLRGTMALAAEEIITENRMDFQMVLDKGRFNVTSHSYTRTYMGESDEAQTGTYKNGDTYSAWERGMNEHFNGLIRRFIPKGKDISHLSQNDLNRFASYINSMPRRKLNYLCPNDLFLKKFCDTI